MDNDIFTFSGSAGSNSKSKKKTPTAKTSKKRKAKAKGKTEKKTTKSAAKTLAARRGGKTVSKTRSKKADDDTLTIAEKDSISPKGKASKKKEMVNRMKMSNDDYLNFVRNYSPAFPSAPSKYEATSTISGPVGDKYTKIHLDEFRRMDKEFGDNLSMSDIKFSTKSMLDKLLRQDGKRIVYTPSGQSDISEHMTGFINDGMVDGVVDPASVKEKMIAFYTDLINKMPSFSVSAD